MADVEILASQVEPAPLEYVIPGGQEILLKCLAASFDGSGAGAPWQPAVAIVGPSGQVLRTFPLSPALAAGASADVSWFPRGAVATGSASPGLGDFVAADTKSPLQSIPDGGTGTPVVFNDGVQGGGAGSVTLNADLTTINMVHAGQYAISANILWTADSTAGVRGALLQTVTNNLDNAIDTAQTQTAENPATSSALACLYHWTAAFTANGSLQIGALVNGAGGPVHIDYAQVTVTLVAPLGS